MITDDSESEAKTKMISITKMKSDSASTASGVDTCSDKINLQLHKLIVDLRDRPRLSKRVEYDNALKFSAQQRHAAYSELANLAEDLTACPSSQTLWNESFWFVVRCWTPKLHAKSQIANACQLET